MLSGKGKNPKEKIQEACKEINYRNLVVLIAVSNYVINQARILKKSLKIGDYHSVPYREQCPENENIVLVEGNTP